MSLPLCPVCGAPDLHVVDRAAEIRPSAPGSPANVTISVHRSYRCACGWTCWTTETVTTWRPSTTKIRKLASDERQRSAG